MKLIVTKKDLITTSKQKSFDDITIADLKMTPYRCAEVSSSVLFADTDDENFNQLNLLNDLSNRDIKLKILK